MTGVENSGRRQEKLEGYRVGRINGRLPLNFVFHNFSRVGWRCNVSELWVPKTRRYGSKVDVKSEKSLSLRKRFTKVYEVKVHN